MSLQVSLLQGYNSVAGFLKGTAVQQSETAPPAPSAVTSLYVSVCSSWSDVATALDISESVAVSYLVDNVSEKMNFSQSLNITKYSVHIIIYGRFETQTSSAGNVTPIQEASSMITDLNGFGASYGDCYINGITMGGEFYAAYSFATETEQEQQDVMASLQASGIAGALKVTTTVSTDFSEALQATKTSWQYAVNMAGFPDKSKPDEDHAISFALGLTVADVKAAVVLSFGWTGYENVPGWNTAFQPVVSNRNRFFSASGLLPILTQIQEINDEFNLINSVYNFYGNYIDDTFSANASGPSEDIEAITGLVGDYASNIATPLSVPSEWRSIQIGRPQLQVSYLSPSDAPWGNRTGGVPFDQVDRDTYVQNRTYISALQLNGGAAVDKIVVTFESDLIKGDPWTDTRGGPGGNPAGSRQLRAGDFVTRLSGYYFAPTDAGGAAHELQYLEIDVPGYPTLQSSTAATSSPSVGFKKVSFEWRPTSGQFLVGFAGRSGTLINSLTPIFVTFSPATWPDST